MDMLMMNNVMITGIYDRRGSNPQDLSIKPKLTTST